MISTFLFAILLAAAPRAVAEAPSLPPVDDPVATPAAAWFVEDPSTGTWCAFAEEGRAEAWLAERMARALPTDATRRFGRAWVRDGVVNEVEIVTFTEDAVAEDRYALGPGGRMATLRRTGRYIHSPMATFVYVAAPDGRLRLDEASLEVVRRMDEAGQVTYIQDWDVAASVRDLPFSSLLETRDGAVRASAGCRDAAPAPRP